MDMLKKKGIFDCNLKKIKLGQPLIRERAQNPKPNHELKMCSHCDGVFLSHTIARHMRGCRQMEERRIARNVALKPDLFAASPCLYKMQSNEEFEVNVLNRFRNDRVGNLWRNDQCIITVGYRLWE